MDPAEYNGCRTIWELFQNTVKNIPNGRFLGTRNNAKEGRPYEFITFRETYDKMDHFARGTTK